MVTLHTPPPFLCRVAAQLAGGQVSSGAWLVATPRISGRWNTLSWREHSAFSFRTESDPQSARMFSQPISMSFAINLNTNFAVVKCHHQYIYETAIRCYLAASYVIVLLLISISVLIYLLDTALSTKSVIRHQRHLLNHRI